MEEKIIIERFAKQMQIELEHNNHKGSVLEWNDYIEMIADLEYHKSKMMLAIRSKNKMASKEYIADCANILMAIGNLLRLYDEETIDNGLCSETEEYMFKQVEIEHCNKNVNSKI